MFDFNFLEQLISADEIEFLTEIALIYGAVFSVSLIIGLICYVFQSIGLYKMAKNLGFARPWLAWLPLCNIFTLGRIGSSYIKRNGKPSAKFSGWLLSLYTLSYLFGTAYIVTLGYGIFKALEIILDISNSVAPETAILANILPAIGLSVLYTAFATAYGVIYYIALWRIYAVFDNSNATVFLILSILFPITTPFFLFAMRNNIPCVTHNERIGYFPKEAPNE